MLKGMHLSQWRAENKDAVCQYTVFLLIAFAASYYYVHLLMIMTREHPLTTLTQLMNGEGHVPSQYRILYVWLIKWTMLGIARFTHWQVTLYSVIYWYELATMLLYVLAFRYFLSLFIKGRLTTMLFSFGLLLVLPYNFLLALMYDGAFSPKTAFFKPLFFVSDIPSMMFFTIGLILIYKRKWLLYYPLFFIATFNRETTAFLTIIFLLTAWGNTRPRVILKHVIAQAAIWAVIKGYLYTLYGDNGGPGMFDFTLMKNLVFLSNMKNYPVLISIMGGLWLPALLFNKAIPSAFLRRAVFALVPYFITLTMVGNLFELRIFGEFIPVTLCATIMIARVFLLREGREPVEYYSQFSEQREAGQFRKLI